MQAPTHPDRRFLVAIDMERYGRQDNLQQVQSQRTLHEVLDEAVTSIGLDRSTWTTQQGGDGELAILPTGTAEPMVIGELVPMLNRVLRARNRSLVPTAKVRLRVAVHQGLVHLDGANGFPGQAVVDVCRLCDAGPLKRALAAFPTTAVALIVSDSLYHDVVSHGYAGIRPERFQMVRVDLPDKGFTATAWIYVPDEDVTSHRDDLDTESERPAAGATAPAATPSLFAEGAEPTTDGRHRSDRGDRTSGFAIDRVSTSGPTVFGHGGTAIGTIHQGGTP